MSPATDPKFIEQFKAYFPTILHEIMEELAGYEMPADIVTWIEETLTYNVPGGKMNRGVAVLITTAILDPTLRVVSEAIVLGWCIEILQACFLIADDVMDQSETRRGRPCWYKSVGLKAVNDALLLESLVYRLLRRHFVGNPCYSRLIELFHEVTLRTELGQLLDLSSIDGDTPVLSRFSCDRYYQTIRNKTAFYSFVLPVHAALILAGEGTAETMAESETAMCKLGEFFQIQDDYLDFYGDPKITGKIGTDLEEGKCTWLGLKFLEIAEQNDIKTFTDAIGRAETREIVARLYRKYELDAHYRTMAEQFRSEYCESLTSLSNPRVKQIAEAFASLILGRNH